MNYGENCVFFSSRNCIKLNDITEEKKYRKKGMMEDLKKFEQFFGELGKKVIRIGLLEGKDGKDVCFCTFKSKLNEELKGRRPSYFLLYNFSFGCSSYLIWAECKNGCKKKVSRKDVREEILQHSSLKRSMNVLILAACRNKKRGFNDVEYNPKNTNLIEIHAVKCKFSKV